MFARPNSQPLLLAPAGSPEALRAAIAAGADAVYVGLMGWSRGGARGELTEAEVRAGLAEAHGAGRGLLVALNTIPGCQERARLLARIAAGAAWGIDGAILNDPGLLAEVHRRHPALPLTASIGCTALNAEDVAFFQAIGASSVVLPGTLDPAEIAAMGRVEGIQLEVMIHMVDEFILLGKCWMPSYVHLKPTPLPEAPDDGRRLTGSMKRGGAGACFRICQQPWDLHRDGRLVDRRLFPSRQVSRADEVGAYLAAGVGVIKLQGRSLPADLLAPIVRRYRAAIDAWREGRPAEPPPKPAPKPAPAAVLPQSWTVVGR